MCGRIIQAAGPLRYKLVDGLDVRDSRLSKLPRHYNGAPSQEFLVIRQNHRTAERSLDLLKWGLVPNWCREAKPQLKPINAKAEKVATTRMFAESYARRRCIVPVDGFFEWRSTKGGRQPYAIAMKDGSPFGLAGLWDNWKDPASGEWVRTFTIITVPANDLVASVHDRMPAILKPADYDRWLGVEPDPRDLLALFPSGAMTMWPGLPRVNAAQNDEPSLLDRVPESANNVAGG